MVNLSTISKMSVNYFTVQSKLVNTLTTYPYPHLPYTYKAERRPDTRQYKNTGMGWHVP